MAIRTLQDVNDFQDKILVGSLRVRARTSNLVDNFLKKKESLQPPVETPV